MTAPSPPGRGTSPMRSEPWLDAASVLARSESGLVTHSETPPDLVALNTAMVDRLVEQGALEAGLVQEAFRSVLRHWFLPGIDPSQVYAGHAIPTRFSEQGPISSSSEPAIMAKMLAQLGVVPDHAVLEIGAGTGYNAALLSYLVGPKGSVVTIDLDEDITAQAKANLVRSGTANVTVLTGDGWKGAPGSGPFDRIEATVGVWDLSPAWIRQLKPEGRLVVPLWLRCGLQASVAFDLGNDGVLRSSSVQPCGFMTLRGLGAGPQGYYPVGAWTALLDMPDRDRVDLLARLLNSEPKAHSLRGLKPGWFVALALGEPNAVRLYPSEQLNPVLRCGLIDAEDESLAVIESPPEGPDASYGTLLSYGGQRAAQTLRRNLEHLPAAEMSRLVLRARPTGLYDSNDLHLAVIQRPEFTFEIDGG